MGLPLLFLQEKDAAIDVGQSPWIVPIPQLPLDSPSLTTSKGWYSYRVFGWRAAGAERPAAVWMGAPGVSGSRGNIPLVCELAPSLRIRGTEPLRTRSCSVVSLPFPPPLVQKLVTVAVAEAMASGARPPASGRARARPVEDIVTGAGARDPRT
jgi:hypothetical protein